MCKLEAIRVQAGRGISPSWPFTGGVCFPPRPHHPSTWARQTTGPPAYTLRDVPTTTALAALPFVVAVGMLLWRRNALISILAGG
jgi:hypothetical protein